MYTALRSKFNGMCSQQANLLTVVDRENSHYTTIKDFSRLFKSLNAIHKGEYHFCLTYLHCFCTGSEERAL